MKKKTILSLILAGVLTLGGSAAAFASNGNRNGENAKSTATYVQSLVNGGLLVDEARKQSLENKIQRVNEKIENAAISQEEGEALKAQLQANYENCDGSNYANQNRQDKQRKNLKVNANNENCQNDGQCLNDGQGNKGNNKEAGKGMHKQQNCDNSCTQN